MKEDYVSIEVAKLLKEKGFDEECSLAIGINYRKGSEYRSYRTNSGLPRDICSKPTLHQAQQWLRKEKGIYVWIEPVIGRKWTTSFCDLNVCAEESDWIERELHKEGYPVYDSYEEALNTGMLEALNLFK